MNQSINPVISLVVVWFDCISNPLTTYRRVLDSPISDREKIDISIRILILAIILSLLLEASLYYYFGIKLEWSFILSWVAYGFFCLFIPPFFVHISLRMFRIKSIFYESFIIYATTMGAYYPFILLLYYPKTFNHFLLIKAIQHEGFSKVLTRGNVNQLDYMFFKEINYDPLIIVISSLFSLLNTMLLLVVMVLLSYAIIERYNSNKYKVFLSIAFSQMFMLSSSGAFLIRDMLLIIYGK